MSMRSVELFSGCGGLALGLSRSGFDHLKMVEWNGQAVETVLHNKTAGIEHVGHWPIERADVRDVDWRPFRGRVELVAGGPPCQPFSIGGKHKGLEDPRDMWPQAIRAVREMSPAAFLFENVKGLSRSSFSDYLAWITASLRYAGMAPLPGDDHAAHVRRVESAAKKADYNVIVCKVNAADYGAPQKRHRVIVAGVKAVPGVGIEPMAPTHSRERLLWDQFVTGTYWERHKMSRPGDGAIDRADLSVVLKLRHSGVQPVGLPWVTVRDALVGLGEPNGKLNHVRQDGARAYPGHTGSPLDQPAKALKAGDHGVPGGENMMVLDDGGVRYFTTREAARLQCLPDDYEFPRSWTESMRQLGNAVPVALGEAVGRWIRDQMTETSQVNSKRAA